MLSHTNISNKLTNDDYSSTMENLQKYFQQKTNPNDEHRLMK